MLEYANRLAATVSEAERELGCKKWQSFRRTFGGVSTTIAQYVLARLLRAFIAEYPKVDLTLHSGNTSEIVRQLLDGKVSVGLIKGPARDRGVRSESFMEDELVPIAAVDAPADSLSRTGFLQSTLLIREQGSGSRQVVESALKRAGFRLSALKEVMTLDSTEAIKSTVEVGYPDRRFAHNPHTFVPPVGAFAPASAFSGPPVTALISE